MSRLACLAARPADAGRRCRPPGLFLIRRDLARTVRISAGGFKICLELLVRGRPASVVEVPYIFSDRAAGESKMNTQGGARLPHAAARPVAVPALASRRSRQTYRRIAPDDFT